MNDEQKKLIDELRDFQKDTFNAILKENFDVLLEKNMDKADEYSCFVDDFDYEFDELLTISFSDREKLLSVMERRDAVIQYRYENDELSYDDVRDFYQKMNELSRAIGYEEGRKGGTGKAFVEGVIHSYNKKNGCEGEINDNKKIEYLLQVLKELGVEVDVKIESGEDK